MAFAPPIEKKLTAQERRIQDESYTRAVEQFLDYIYHGDRRLSGNIYRNETDTQAQKAGIDIFYETDKGPLFVDEKFAINYREKHLNTFSFELESRSKSNDGWTARPGWFINPNNQTTHYMLMWFNSDHDITTINEYEACLISKQTIKDNLAREGIDVDHMLQVFKGFVERGEAIPEGYSLHVGDKISLEHNGYKITQSTQFEEAPINIIIPREKLRDWSEHRMSSRTPIKIQDAVKAMEQQKNPDFSKAITPKTAQLLAERSLVSGTLHYQHGKKISQGMVKQPEQGDKILVNINNRQVPIAQYYQNSWCSLTPEPVLETIMGKRVISMDDMLALGIHYKIEDMLQAMDSMHRPLEKVPEQNIDGTILKVVNPLTHKTEGEFQYHAAINRFVALGDSRLAGKAQFINNVPIISETEYMKMRAFADRFVDYTRRKENRYNGRTYNEALQYAKKAISAITSPEWQLTRDTKMEEALRGLSRQEREELIGALTHEGCINAFVEQLMDRARFNDNPDLFIACMQEENYRTPNHRLSIMDLAREANCLTQPQNRYDTPRIDWSQQAVQRMRTVLENHKTPDKQFTFEGPAPTWAMAAIIHACEPNKVFINDKTYGIIDMQSVMYGNKPGPVQIEHESAYKAATISCHAIEGAELDISKIEVPQIEEGNLVFIKGNIPPQVALAIGELYGESAGAVFYERADGSFICGASNCDTFQPGTRCTDQQRIQAMSITAQDVTQNTQDDNSQGLEEESRDFSTV